ncbi:MAG: APC family permease, partial [archaeon]
SGFPIPPLIVIPSVLSAAAFIFFAYLGFEDLVRLSEDTKNSSKVMPKALMIAILVSTVLYILVSSAAVSIAGSETLAHSAAPLADVAATGFGEDAFLMLAIIALFSTGNTVLLLLLASSRLVYGLSSEQTLPRVLGQTHENQPRNALVFSTLAVLGLALYKDISFVTHITDALLFLVFAAMNAAVILINWREVKPFRGFNVPLKVGKIPIPAVLGMVFALGMLFFVDFDALLFGVGFVFVGMLAHAAWKPHGE